MPPPTPGQPPSPAELHARFSRYGAIDWGEKLPTTAELVSLHGARATDRSLRLIERAVAAEPRLTAEFLAAVPPYCMPYQLEARIKSPESLARKIEDARRMGRRLPPEDVFRYTVLTPAPDGLVAAARSTCEGLRQAGWQAEYAMHSYTEGSRYKGIHAYFVTPAGDRVELQFHSVASVKVKEATTPLYEIERSARSSAEERTAARMECVQLSATLVDPPQLDTMTDLGGCPVTVNNYGDSRRQPTPGTAATVQNSGRQTPAAGPARNEGISR